MIDELKPKKPLTSFLRYCDQHRQKVKDENPDLKGGPAIIKELSNMWNDLNEDEKTAYASNFKEEMEEYKIKLAEWKKNHPDDDEESKKRGTSKGKKVSRKSEDEHEDEKPKKNKAKKGDHDEKKEESKKKEEEKEEDPWAFKLDVSTEALVQTNAKRIQDCMQLIGSVNPIAIKGYIDFKDVKPTEKGVKVLEKDNGLCMVNTSTSNVMEQLFETECKNVQKVSDKNTKFARTVALITIMFNYEEWMNDNDQEGKDFQKFINKVGNLAKSVLNENIGEKVKCLKAWCKALKESIDECPYGVNGGCDMTHKFKYS